MLSKLAIRNAKRSIKDYIIYLITMTVIATLMFAFNAMIFSKDVKGMCSDATIMAAMLGLATFFIILIVAWLINYMVRFMLEKRSREFGTYLLLGMNRREISKLYMRENIILGFVAFVAGRICGIFLYQILMSIFYNIFSENYHVKADFTISAFIMTFGCYFTCYVFALIRNKRTFKKMNISELIRMDKENEKIKQSNNLVKQFYLLFSIIYFGMFFYLLFRGDYSVLGVIFMSIGFVISIYLIYVGFASFIVRYIQKSGKRIYKNQNLFILRMLSSKINTMKITMGTLTVLMTCALLGGTVAMMFGKYQDKVLENTLPFDVIVYSNDPNDDFSEEIQSVEKQVGIDEKIILNIYQNNTHVMNDYLYTHAETLGNKYKNSEGKLDKSKLDDDGYEYYDFDTYIKLSDYNKLRKMLGYKTITLNKNEYAIQIKQRMKGDLNVNILSKKINILGVDYAISNIYTDSMSQNGIVGADYVIVIPDDAAESMTPYYSNLAVSTVNVPGEELQDELVEIRHDKNGIMSEKEFEKLQDQGKIDEGDVYDDITLGGYGTDQIVVITADVLVAAPLGIEMKFVLTSIVFPLVYVGFVFVCVALTILAVQQLSDSNKYKFRYDVLRKLGLSEKKINNIIFRQLIGYYMIPGIMAVILSGVISIFAGNNFVKYTGAIGNGIYYFGIALALFFGVYALYFAATYLVFKRNIRK